MRATDRRQLQGRVLDEGYRVGPLIGEGATGLVYYGVRLDGGASVALKVLRKRFASDPELRARLRLEAHVSRVVAHPGMIPVLDEGQLPDGSPFIVMEHMLGESLAHLLARARRLQLRWVMAIGRRVASILHAVHSAGFVHRDVKPEHILLDRAHGGELRVSLLDLGVCCPVSPATRTLERERGRIFGTPGYVAPEQAGGDGTPSIQSDIYALGATLFECSTGRLPTKGNTVVEWLRSAMTTDAPPLRRLLPDAPEAMEALLARSLSRQPDARPTSARVMERQMATMLPDARIVERHVASRLMQVQGRSEAARTAEPCTPTRANPLAELEQARGG